MVIEGSFPDFPRQQSAETIAGLIKEKKCTCELCKYDTLIKKRKIARELSDLARSSSPDVELRREKLIEEIIKL